MGLRKRPFIVKYAWTHVELLLADVPGAPAALLLRGRPDGHGGVGAGRREGQIAAERAQGPVEVREPPEGGRLQHLVAAGSNRGLTDQAVGCGRQG